MLAQFYDRVALFLFGWCACTYVHDCHRKQFGGLSELLLSDIGSFGRIVLTFDAMRRY